MRSWTGIPELKQSYRQLGRTRFLLVMFGTLTFIAVGAGLSIALDYPQAFGSPCRRKCLVESYWYSPELIRHGTFSAYALFTWLWALPVSIPIAFIYARIKKQREHTFL